MGATISRALVSASLKWAKLVAKPIRAPRLVSEVFKAAEAFGAPGSKKLAKEISNVCTEYSVPSPSPADIAGYQSALNDLKTILEDFKRNKPDYDLLKTQLGECIVSASTSSPPPNVTPAVKTQIISRIGSAMQWGGNQQQIVNNFGAVIVNPMRQFNMVAQTLPSLKQIELGSKHSTLFGPVAISLCMYIIIN